MATPRSTRSRCAPVTRRRCSRCLPADARRVLVEIAKEGLHPAVTETEVHLSQFSNGGVDSVDKIERGVRETARLAHAHGNPA